MKKRALATIMLILMLAAAGCGRIIVEDSEPTVVGSTEFLQKDP